VVMDPAFRGNKVKTNVFWGDVSFIIAVFNVVAKFAYFPFIRQGF